MSKYQKCVDKIKSQVAEGKISDAKARELLAELDQRQKIRETKGELNRENALREIAGDILNEQKWQAEKARRNALLNVKAYRASIVDAIKENNLGTGLQRRLERTAEKAKTQGNKRINAFIAELKANEVYDFFRKASREDQLNVAKEVWELSQKENGRPGITGSKEAAAVAKVWERAFTDLAATENRWGASIKQAAGWMFPQIVDAQKLRGLAIKGWGKADMDASLKAFKEFMSTLNIDAERSLKGVDMDTFLRRYFVNQYTGVHLKEQDFSGIDHSGHGNGSMSSKESAARELWFADAESAFKFNEAFGKHSVLEAMFARLQRGSRVLATMADWGPDPGGTIRKVSDYLAVRAKDKADSLAQESGILKAGSSADVIMGKTSESIRPGLSKFVDGLKAITLLSKGANMVFSALQDKATIDTAMAYRGVSSANRWMAHAQGLVARSADSKARLRDMSVYLDAHLGETSAAWVSDIGANRWLNKRVSEVFEWTQFTRVNEVHRHGVAAAYAAQLADEAHLSFDNLSPERARDFKDYSINKAEWDLWRNKVENVGMAFGDYKMLLPDFVDRLTDVELDKIVEARGLNPTAPNRARVRDELDMKLRALFGDVVGDATTENTLRYRAGASIGKMRGEYLREMAELFTMFKSYPVNAVIRMIERERRLTGASSLGDWVAQHGIPGSMRLAWHIGKTIMLGVLAYQIAEMRKGKTPAPLMLPDGKVNWDLWFNGAARGGGLGIYGDWLLTEYDDRTRTFSQALMGPVLGELDPIMNLKSRFAGTALGEKGEGLNRLGYQGTTFLQQNVPYMNLFFIKPAMDYLIFNQMYEAFAPGIAAHRAGALEGRGQEYLGPIYDPRDAVAADPLGVQKNINSALDSFAD